MAKPTLKLPSIPLPHPFHPDEPPSPHTRQVSLNIARSPSHPPATSAVHVSSPHQPALSPTHSYSHSRSGKGSYTSLPPGRLSEDEAGTIPVIQLGEEEEEEEADLRRDLEAFDLEYEDAEDQDVVRYDGPFQPPVGKEMVGIVLSIVGVSIFAVAAGLTTVYDWIL